MSLIIKYAGNRSDSGLTLTVSLVDDLGQVTAFGIPLIEVGTSSLFVSNNLVAIGEPFENGLAKGTYAIRILGEVDEQRGAGILEWDGAEEITANDIKDRLWNRIEKMEIRDALGVDGDKQVASGGQLQKKSEYPHNSTIDTETVHENDDTNPPI